MRPSFFEARKSEKGICFTALRRQRQGRCRTPCVPKGKQAGRAGSAAVPAYSA